VVVKAVAMAVMVLVLVVLAMVVLWWYLQCAPSTQRPRLTHKNL
jgi:hypothetical protein